MPSRILVTEPIVETPLNKLREKYKVSLGDRAYYDNEEHLVEDIEKYDAALTMLSNPITERVIESAHSLKIIANMAAGYDNINVQAARNSGIYVSNTPGVLTDSTADLTIALLLATARRLSEAENFVRAGKFDGWHPLGFLGVELNEATLGILGMGRIGTAVAKRARGFGMNIIYHNRNPVEQQLEKHLEATYIDTVMDLAQQADILSLNCPLNEDTYHAVDQDVFENLGKHGILVNTARGAVVDEHALIQALHEETIAGAALDVFEKEPEIPASLYEAPNCIMTPHIGSATHKTRKKMGMLAVTSIEAALNGKNPSDIPNLVS